MNAKHSKGPFEVKARGCICAPGSILVAETRSYISSAAVNSDEEQDANDLLFAAAPDLLQALKVMMAYEERYMTPEKFGYERYRLAREAMLKAEPWRKDVKP